MNHERLSLQVIFRVRTYLASVSVGSQTDNRGGQLHFVDFLQGFVFLDHSIFTGLEVDIGEAVA